MYQRILVATDGSALSKKAVSTAIELAALSQAELVAMKVVPRYPMSYFEGGVVLTGKEVKQIEQQWAQEAQAVVDKVRDTAAKHEVVAKPIIVRADLVAEAIIATAKKQRCDLIVMSSHGRRGLKRVLLGSETQHVLTHSNVPVLVLR